MNEYEKWFNNLSEHKQKEIYNCDICHKECPNCGETIEMPGALSRRDNETEICSDCGTREALEDYAKGEA